MRLGPHTITVVRPGTKPVDYGSGTQPDWDTATRTTVDGCSVQPAPADEFTVDRDTFITRWQVFAPGGTDASATDRVEWQGDTYDIDGDVLRWEFGALAHVVITLRRSTDS
jgi:hypothetical protein